MREVFDHDGCARLDVVENALAQHVVAILSEALFTSREAMKVAFSRLAALGLQFSLQSKTSLADFAPVLFTMRPAIGSNGRAADAHIDAKGFLLVEELHVVHHDDNVQIPLAFAIQEVGRRAMAANSIGGIGGQGESNRLFTLRGGKANRRGFPVHFVGVKVESGRTGMGTGAGGSTSLLLACQRGLDGFAGFLSRLNVQVGNKFRIGVLAVAIRELVQIKSVAVMQPPAFGANGVEGLRELRGRLYKDVRLLGIRF